jgi:protein SCO1/2
MKTRIILFLAILLTGIGVAAYINYNYYRSDISDDPDEELSAFHRSKNNRLRVYNPIDINPTLVDSSLHEVRKDHVIGDFSFLNQLGDTITKADIAGKIAVVDFFFTTCGGICPKMTSQLKRIQTEFRHDENFKILSHTVNPKVDSVAVMHKYALRFDADSSQWWFLTGRKDKLYTMARKSYLVVPDKADPNFDHGDESDFIHTENFVLIDPDGRIRGMIDGTDEGQVAELIRDIYDLKKEYNQD